MIFRDRLAIDRTALAAERTFLAYIRTALTFFIAGVSFVHFFEMISLSIIGWIFTLTGIFLFIFAPLRFNIFNKRLKYEVYKYEKDSLAEGKN